MKRGLLIDQLKYSFGAVQKNAKVAFWSSILSKFVNLSKVFVFSYINKMLINQLAFVLTSGKKGLITSIINIVLINWIIVILYGILDKIFIYMQSSSMMNYNIKMNQILYRKLAEIDMANFDMPSENDKIKQSFKDMTGILSMFENSLNIVFSIMSCIIAFFIVLSFDVFVSLSVIIVLIPTFFIQERISIEKYKMDQKLNLKNRRIDYYAGVFFDKSIAQDLRMHNNLKELMLDKHAYTSQLRNKEKKLLLKKNTLIDIIYSGGMGFVNAALNVYILYTIVAQNLTIGDFNYYTAITSRLRKSIEDLIINLNEIVISGTKVDNFRTFINSENKVFNSGVINSPPNRLIFEFNNVSFIYPNTKNYILKNVNFKFDAKTKIAIAGTNGAGKTTLIKLLLRYYDPSEGEILLNGVNIKNYKTDEYRNIFSVMFQNYVNYKIPIKENISFSRNSSSIQIQEALSFVELDDIDVEKELSKTFSDDGVILSPGQAQRLNFARTIYKKSRVYIFDEPSASLDAKAEQDIFDKVFTLTQNMGLILISHRLSNLRYVDNIIFLENGSVSEVGSHIDLVNKRGAYYELYNIQSKKYYNSDKENN